MAGATAGTQRAADRRPEAARSTVLHLGHTDERGRRWVRDAGLWFGGDEVGKRACNGPLSHTQRGRGEREGADRAR